MTLATGTRFGPYEIAELLGAGGMGEVYRARDTRLGREVAVKVLPQAFAEDAERLARFEREARVLAGLNHPHIAVVHGLEQQTGAGTALVMELIDGQTLAERLAAGPLPIDEALGIAKQVADALEAAHEHGIVHRDLKPANVKVRSDGTVKVLDFGLAKALSPADDSADPAHSPTLSMAATRAGQILGTAAYMAPEQARGAPIDRTVDLWSFGCLLFELLAGRAAFAGEDTTDIIAAVLKSEPDWSSLPADTPPAARMLLRQCLRKRPGLRLGDARAARLIVEEALAELAAPAVPAPRTSAFGRHSRWVAVVVATAAVGTLLASRLVTAPTVDADARVVRLEIARPGRSPGSFAGSGLAVSPDGNLIVYGYDGTLWLRSLDRLDSVALRRGGSYPFFSPDGQWIGMFVEGNLERVSAAGGTTLRLAAIGGARWLGGSWGTDGTIVYATGLGLHRISADGGVAELIASPDPARDELRFAWPRLLPDGGSMLFTIVRDGDTDRSDIAVLDLATSEHRVILRGGAGARYLPSGHLVYAVGGRLLAVAVSDSLDLLGSAVQIDDVDLARGQEGADFDVSPNGTLAYTPPGRPWASTLVWVDRDGREEPVPAPPRAYWYPRISPDGTRAAFDIPEGNRDVWVWHFERQVMTRLTDHPTEDLMPAWSADNRRVFFASDIEGVFRVYARPADASAPAELLLEADEHLMPFSAVDAERLLVRVHEKGDVAVLHLQTPRRLEPLLEGPYNVVNAQVSPDGAWIAYQSNETGQHEVYIQSFPDLERRREVVSRGGGVQPLWGPEAGGELYYRTLDGTVAAVRVELEPDLRLGATRELFPDRGYTPTTIDSAWTYAVSPIDGRFLMIKEGAPPEAAPIRVVVNWLEELEGRVAAR